MSKYLPLNSAIFSIFGSDEWISNNISVYPQNFNEINDSEYLRISIIPNSPGINQKSTSGQLIVDIFIAAGSGPTRATTIADLLDSFLVGVSKTTTDGVVQFFNSAVQPYGIDQDNPTLYRTQYTLPFSFFGAL
jgi:hypothetical protein